MAKAAENDELRSAFEEHQSQTEEHVARLEKVFEIFEEAPKGKKCKAMAGLIEEAKDLIEEEEGDAALIAAAQKAEHYEISAYGTLSAWGEALGESEAVDILQETLEEESDTDEKLTSIAESVVNDLENSEEGEEDEEEDESESQNRTKSGKKSAAK
jgi:ferritin-like metal-binding protein YciE